MTGLSLNPAGDDFVLRRVTAEGNTTEMTLSALEVLTLADHASNLRQQILEQFHLKNRESGPAVIALNVYRVEVHQEMLGETLLVTLLSGTAGSSHTTYAFPQDIAEWLAQKLSEQLEKMRAANPTKQ